MIAFFAVTGAWVIEGSAAFVADFFITFETNVFVARICMVEPEIRTV